MGEIPAAKQGDARLSFGLRQLHEDGVVGSVDVLDRRAVELDPVANLVSMSATAQKNKNEAETEGHALSNT